MHGNVDAALLWLILLDKYLVNELNLKRSKANSYILFKEYDKGRLEIVMSVYVDDVFVDGKPEPSNNTK